MSNCDFIKKFIISARAVIVITCLGYNKNLATPLLRRDAKTEWTDV